ncbi:cell division protein PerM [Nocardioides marmoribigeumensis]|uniref:Integral membrane protein n=1 Tax=Nocardioides marmoribigeumensis TaxID=433649 RepID=A0ABU2BZX5_9ACTN|nr:DUF6350 family protein [Nocardioides marmoribigeumensis]MDR7363924.1 hypothetical protein [Nocardioides marmoribigeumensis]
MTDLLSRPTRAPRDRAGSSGSSGGGRASEPGQRALAVSAAWAGVVAPAILLAVFWGVALVGWFSSDGGSHGTTRTALRIGADAWLLAHGAHLQVGAATVTAVPLGLSLLCAYVAFRAGRWAGATSEVEDLMSLGLGAVVLGGTYASVALVAAILAATPAAAPDPLRAFLGGAVVAGVAGGLGLVVGSGLRAELRALLPTHARAVLFGGLVAFLATYAAGAVLSGLAVAVRGQSVANVLAGLHLDGAGAFFSVGLVAVLAPNLAGWGASYLLGPGFALGTGTVVAPSGVVLGPVPAVPVLAAVPGNGPAPGWALAVLAVPVLCGLYAGRATLRRFPTRSYAVGAARSAGAGLLAAVALAFLAAVSGGSVGSGRMTDVGPAAGPTLLMSLATVALGAVVAGLLQVWWRTRHGDEGDLVDEGPLDRSIPWRDREAAAGRAEARSDRRRERRARRRGVAVDDPRADVPGWADLGVWSASTRHVPRRSGPSGETQAVHPPDDGEQTAHVPRPE